MTYRILIYLFALLDIAIGFLIYYRACGRFGFQTYRQFLDQEECEDREGRKERKGRRERKEKRGKMV